MLVRGDCELSALWRPLRRIGQTPTAGDSNPPPGSGSNGTREIRGMTGSRYRNVRSGGFGALQAPATNLFNVRPGDMGYRTYRRHRLHLRAERVVEWFWHVSRSKYPRS